MRMRHPDKRISFGSEEYRWGRPAAAVCIANDTNICCVQKLRWKIYYMYVDKIILCVH